VAYYRHIYASVGGFHINLSGEEKEKLITLLMTELPKVRDPKTDAPVIKTVYRGEDCFYGPYAANVPDVVIAMHWQYSGNSALSQYSSLVQDIFSAVEEGQHHPEGVFGALGPMIAAQAKGLPQLNIQDIAPTVLYLMGLPVPNDMDGRPLTEIVPPEFLQTNPVQFGQPTEFWPSNQAAQEAQQAEANLNDEVVKDRLRALGYFE
jgi:predicted AlkP superfamily phosphohydrolase/phosphomutase